MNIGKERTIEIGMAVVIGTAIILLIQYPLGEREAFRVGLGHHQYIIKEPDWTLNYLLIGVCSILLLINITLIRRKKKNPTTLLVIPMLLFSSIPQVKATYGYCFCGID